MTSNGLTIGTQHDTVLLQMGAEETHKHINLLNVQPEVTLYNLCIFSGQKATSNYYARNTEPWDNAMFVGFGYDAETPSNSHLYVAAQHRPKMTKLGRERSESTSSNDSRLNQSQGVGMMGGLTVNGSVDEENGQQYDSGAYGDPCEDQDDDLNNEYNAGDMADLYDPCVQDDYADMQGGEIIFHNSSSKINCMSK